MGEESRRQHWQEMRERLKEHDPRVRCQALEALVAAWHERKIECAPPHDLVNMHCHTFFSYNGYGHSPTSLAWLARKKGWRALGTVDFDVLDGVEETLTACDTVGVRGASGMETRAFCPTFADKEINSPGEPGVIYYVGVGFTPQPIPPFPKSVLRDMRTRAAERNRQMIERLNAYLDPVTIDYEDDVLPLTPSGNATERHMVIAYDRAARERYPEREDLLAYWARKLDLDVETVDGFVGDEPYPHNEIRSKLMKRGGVGYAQPGPDTFPPLEQVNETIIASGAIPSYPFLDGMSEGEQDLDGLLHFLVDRGMAALTVIPDRNWNIEDPQLRAQKVERLHQALNLARALDLPVLAGTEMNKAGQRLVDDFENEALRPFLTDFLQGADWLYGHTLMQRALGRGFQSDWARRHLPERSARNAFYAQVGGLVEPGTDGLGRVARLSDVQRPRAILSRLQD
ncbi:MAG: hypothetical protein U9R48_11135 [Chloroflexota bacterium]|nr:hypothetical protein [Chloroflexota bacterium]